MQEDLQGDVLKEKFYPQQLHIVSNFDLDNWEFEVEHVLKERKNKKTGKSESFVRYLFYPGNYVCLWMTFSTIKSYNCT